MTIRLLPPADEAFLGNNRGITPRLEVSFVAGGSSVTIGDLRPVARRKRLLNPAAIEALERVAGVCEIGVDWLLGCLRRGTGKGDIKLSTNPTLKCTLTDRSMSDWNSRYFDRYHGAGDMLLECILTKQAVLVITGRYVIQRVM